MNLAKRFGLKGGLLAALLANSAMAGWSTNNVTITSVEVNSDGGTTSTYLTFSATPNGKPAGCSAAQAKLVGSSEHIATATSVATAAFLAGKEVRVYWSTTCVSGTTFGKIEHISIR